LETLADSQLPFIPRGRVQDVCARILAAALALAASVAATVRRVTEATADLVFLDLPGGSPRCCSASLATRAGSSRRK
jgi:hypothetical protein